MTCVNDNAKPNDNINYLRSTLYAPRSTRYGVHVSGTHFSTALTIDTGRDDASGIPGTFATREEPMYLDMHERFSITQDTHRT